MNPIVKSAWKAIAGDYDIPQGSGYCLALVRRVVEEAYRMPPHGFYKWRTHTVERKSDLNIPWARDMERSLRAAGMEVEAPRTGPELDPKRYVEIYQANLQEGDLLFRWDVARSRTGEFIGHVGIYLGHELVLENINPSNRNARRGMSRGVNRITPLGEFPVTTIIRFDPKVKPKGDPS
jgi:hypothetical protein